jgi:hypothetical protein
MHCDQLISFLANTNMVSDIYGYYRICQQSFLPGPEPRWSVIRICQETSGWSKQVDRSGHKKPPYYYEGQSKMNHTNFFYQ